MARTCAASLAGGLLIISIAACAVGNTPDGTAAGQDRDSDAPATNDGGALEMSLERISSLEELASMTNCTGYEETPSGLPAKLHAECSIHSTKVDLYDFSSPAQFEKFAYAASQTNAVPGFVGDAATYVAWSTDPATLRTFVDLLEY